MAAREDKHHFGPTGKVPAMNATRVAQCYCAGILVADHLCTPIDHLPRAGELVLAQRLPLEIGGCAANAAIGLARLGIDVAVVGQVGQDPFGRFVVEQLQQHGVQTQHVRTAAEPTSGTLIINVQGEDRRFIHSIGANGTLRAEVLDFPELEQARVLFVGGYRLMPQLVAEELGPRLERLRQQGVRVVLDVVIPDEQDHWSQVAPLLPLVDVFLPNRDEAQALTGQEDPVEQARTLQRQGAGTVVITCGDQGAVVCTAETCVRLGTYPVEYVGGTGSGDAFTAGYIYGMLQGKDPIQCAVLGSAMGASCVRGVGATETLFDRQELEQFVQQHSLEITPV